jgi:voltage-gated potassium channel
VANFSTLLGMSGVSDTENHHARKAGTYFEAPMLLLAIWVVALWYLEQKHLVTDDFVWVSDLTVWGFFILETTILTALVNDKKQHLINNWMNLVIICAGLPVIFEHTTLAPILRSFRLLLLVALFVNMFSTLRSFLAKNNLGITLFISLALAVIVGIYISVIDPAIETPADGLWWAWVTVTTVGYGDIVPTSGWGRIIGAGLILVGFGLFSLLTASISAFMMSREEEEVIDREEHILKKLDILVDQLAKVEQRLTHIETKLNDDSSRTQNSN